MFHTTSRRRALIAAAAAFALPTVQAQTPGAAPATRWPTRPVRIIVPLPPGSAPDVLLRLMGQKLSERWGQAVVVDNKPGGSGVVGGTALLNAPADGTVFGFLGGAALSIAPRLVQGVPYDFHRDFVPISQGAVMPVMLAVPADSPYKTLADFLAAARAKPKGIEIADVGRGTAPNLATVLLGLKAGVEFLPVHYAGGAQAMQGTLSGETRALVDSYNVLAGNVQGGKLRVLASMADRPLPGQESFPLAKDTVPGVVASGWFAMVGRKGLPADVIAKMNRDVVDVLRLPEVVAKFHELGSDPQPGTPQELARFFDEDRQTWKGVLDVMARQPR